MGNESGEWIMHGIDWKDPKSIHSYRELIDYVNRVGFLPLFKNEVDGFSVEEYTDSAFWWSDNPERDPWLWREMIAASGEVAYGKFFGKKAGFISLEWFPVFANYRRDGYDFDARYEDGLAKHRSKKIMDCFETKAEYMSPMLKEAARFGKGKEKNFEGVVSELQMQTYLVVKDFRQRTNKKGVAYGMAATVYAKPEDLWGYDRVTSCYREEPKDSRKQIFQHMRKMYPNATEKQIEKIVK